MSESFVVEPSVRVTRRALILFIVGAVSILVLETAEKYQLINNLSESIGRLLVWIPLLYIIARAFQHVGLERRIAITGAFCIGAIVVSLSLQLFEDIRYFDGIPFIGHDSSYRHFSKKAIGPAGAVAAYTSLINCLVFLRRENKNWKVVYTIVTSH